MTSVLLLIVVAGIVGALLASLAALIGVRGASKALQSQILTVPTDDVIEPPSQIPLAIFRTY